MPVTYITSNLYDANGNYTGQSGTTTHTNAYAGAVLDIGWETVQIMSDIWEDRRYALLWDADKNTTRKIDLTTEGCSGQIDATPEVIAAYRAMLYKNIYARRYQHALDYCNKPRKNSTVTVKRGRNNVGAKGVVRVVKEMPYNMGYKSVWRDKLGISTSDRTKIVTFNGKQYTNYVDMIWVWADNVEVDNAEALVNVSEVAKAAESEVSAIISNLPAKDLPVNTNRQLYNAA